MNNLSIETIVERLFPPKFDENLTPGQRFFAEIRQKALELQKIRQDISFTAEEMNELFEKVDKIAEFIRHHVGRVGKEQAIKDIQLAFNLLCNSKKNAILEELKVLKEDGDLGQKTFACLKHVCKHYSTEVIKEYLKLGAMNNAIFETKNDNSIITKKLVEEIRKDLSLEGKI